MNAADFDFLRRARKGDRAWTITGYDDEPQRDSLPVNVPARSGGTIENISEVQGGSLLYSIRWDATGKISKHYEGKRFFCIGKFANLSSFEASLRDSIDVSESIVVKQGSGGGFWHATIPLKISGEKSKIVTEDRILWEESIERVLEDLKVNLVIEREPRTVRSRVERLF